MMFTLFGIIVAVIFTSILLFIAESSDNFIVSILSIIMAFFTGIAIIAYCILALEWKASEYKVGIINREYGVSYTREEIFYAKDVIETIKNLNRNRYEINGSITKEN